MPSVVTRDFNELDNARGQIRLMRAARGLRGWKAAAEHPFLVCSHETWECKICGYQLSHVVVVRPPISDKEKGVCSLLSVPSRPCWAFYRRPRGRATRPFRGGSSCCCCGLMLRSHDISSTKLIGQGNAAACRPRPFCQQLLPLNYADWQIYSRRHAAFLLITSAWVPRIN